METINIKDVPLDIRQQKFVSVGDFYQNDTNIIKFTLSDNNNPADLSNVDEILINYKRPDGEIISRLLEAESNIINYQLGQSEMQVVGLGKLVLQFFSNDKRLSTFIVNVSVKKSIETNFEFEEGENPLVDQLFGQMNNFKERLDNLPIGGGDGSLVFQTLSDLQNEFPNGTSQPVWVVSENSWYYWSGGNVEPQPDTIPPILTITSGGNFTDSKIITMNTNETASIHYTLNGSTPTVNSPKYTNQLTINATTTLKAFARDTAGNSSAVQTIVYTLVVPEPGDTTPPDNVTNLQVSNNTTGTSLTLTWTASTSSDVAGYEIYKGSTLSTTVTGTSYNVTGLTANTPYTFVVKAKDTSGNIASGTSVTVTTTLVDAIPPILTITPTATFTNTQTVTMSTNETATIYYTLDGTTPTQTSPTYSTPLTLNATTTVKAFAKDTAGNVSSIQTVTYTKEMAISYIVQDNFNRNDSTRLGTSSSGHEWIDTIFAQGYLTISNNTALKVTTAGNSEAVIDAGVSDVSVQSEFVINGGSGTYFGIVFRYTDDKNFLVARYSNGNITLFKFVDNAPTTLGLAYTMSGVVGTLYTLKVVANGSTIEVYLNNNLIINATDAFNELVTKHGIRVSAGVTVDNFKIW